jgi:hypothetical protein
MTLLQALADEPRWVAWRNEVRRGKLTKVPYAPDDGKAKVDNPSTWGIRAAAESRAKKIVNGRGGGIGIQLGDLGGDLFLAGADLDSCIDEHGCLAVWGEKVLVELPTYAEVSPSGRGLKAFFYCASEDVRRFLDLIGVTNPNQWGVKRGVGENGANHGPGIEIYFANRYFAVTERVFPGKPDRIELLDWLALDRLARLIPPQNTGNPASGRDNSRSAKAFREGARLRRQGKTFKEMCEALRNHSDPDIAAWTREKGEANGMRELHRIWDKAQPPPGEDEGVSLQDFYAYMPMHKYFFAPSRELWPASSVDARVPPIPLLDPNGNPILHARGKRRGESVEIAPSDWLDKHQPVEQVTWAPGEDMVIRNRLISEGGWIRRRRVSCFNLYRPPVLTRGDPKKAGPWVRHVLRVYPDKAEARHIIRWLAHRVQHPAEKINHALVLGGEQGIGKDTIIEPVKRAVGPWNGQEESPRTILESRFNGYLKAVILRISEARDLGEAERHTFYEHMKAIIAAPPDVLRINEKNVREYYIPNVVGVLITTNHKTDGIHLPEDDRRHYVAWSPRTRSEFSEQYFTDFYRWLDTGGDRHVAAYLASLDLSGFNPKAPPPQTQAFWDIVNVSRVPENAGLADLLDQLNNPDAVTIARIIDSTRDADGSPSEFGEWLKDRCNRRKIPHRMEACGYVAVRNPDAKDGLWKISGARQAVYSKVAMSPSARLQAATNLTAQK